MNIKVALALVSLVSCIMAQSSRSLSTGYYTISDPKSGEVIICDGDATGTPIRRKKGVLQDEGIWHLELRSYPLPAYKLQYNGTSCVAQSDGRPGAVVYTVKAPETPMFFHIESTAEGNQYQIASDAYNVLAWTRADNNTVTLEMNSRSTKQLWNITPKS